MKKSLEVMVVCERLCFDCGHLPHHLKVTLVAYEQHWDVGLGHSSDVIDPGGNAGKAFATSAQK